MDIPERPDLHSSVEVPENETESSARASRVRRAAEVWKGQLVDLGGRNTLLYYKDLKQGTLDIGPKSGAAQHVVDSLLGTNVVRLSAIFPDPERLAIAATKARTVAAKARAMFEERGLRTQYLAWGMATWTTATEAPTPAAPILMASMALTSRGRAGEDFDLSLTDDFEVNPTFLHLLNTDFAVRLSSDELIDLLGMDSLGAPDPDPLFEHMTKACPDIQGFAITPRVVLGNFSYAKLSMVKDLEMALDQLIEHDLIAAIAGDPEAQQVVRDRHTTVTLEDPNFVPLKDEFLILDTDSSQNFAINAVVAGKDLVIDGPPGTGKSQTIANLIASLVAHRRKVLFVAEKRAAIDAVLKRLDKVGLSDLVLDLHDGVGNRRKLAEELARSLAAAASIPAPDLSALPAQEKRRGRLIVHDQVLHSARVPWAVSVYQAQAAVLGTPPHLHTDFRMDASTIKRLDAGAASAARDAIADFAELDGPNLLYGSAPSLWANAIALASIASPDRVTQAFELVKRLSGESIPDLIRDLNGTARGVGLEPAGSLTAWDRVINLWSRVALTLTRLRPAIYESDLPTLTSELAPATNGAIRRGLATVLNGRYRKAKRDLRSLSVSKMPARDLLAAVSTARAEKGEWIDLREGDSLPSHPTDLDSLSGRLAQVEAEVDTLASWIGLNGVRELTAGALLDLMSDLRAQQDVLQKLPRLTQLKAHLDAVSLEPLVREVAQRGLRSEEAVTVFEHSWNASILEWVSMNDPEVGTFRREPHDKAARDFAAGDHRLFEATPRRVLRAVAEEAVQARTTYPQEERVIVQQSKLKRKHMAARDLFQAAPHVLTAMKPCWAMSPLVASQILPAQAGLFDVVVFDEASQIQPADAVGPLLRGRQAVVAGDPRQLPPTTFFLTSDGDGDDDDGGAMTANMESVLDAMSVLLPPPIGTRTLNWHYRSRDERLIAFSNAQPALYDWSLTTFPGVAGNDCLRHILVPFEPGGQGQEESVAREVDTVVELILEHARERPDESLGVIAMGIKHAERVAEMLRRTRTEHPELDAFFDENATEPLFVKNLERVQGDERDAIILTIGYGKTADGRMLYRFGPIGQQGGERRLNVAITRARTRMTVVSSFSAFDMDPTRLHSEGPLMLQRYLQYAESGGANLGHHAKVKPDMNPFERDVFVELSAAGIPLVPQMGSSGYWIDFVARHPTKPGRMVLAIETDGAMYHSTPTARDRDRLRQEHLERLGWTFHRIWSTSWFRNREAEVGLALQAFQSAVRRADGDEEDSPSGGFPAAPEPSSPGEGLAPLRGPRPNVPRGLGISDYSRRQLVALVKWVESDTLLRTGDELLQAVMDDLGFERRGSRILDAIAAAIREAHN